MYKGIPTSLSFQFHSHSLNYWDRVFRLARPETTCGSALPPLFIIVVTVSNTFPSIFPANAFFSTHPSHFRASGGPTKRRIDFPSCCHLSICGRGRGIWGKGRIEKFSKIGQSKKSSISIFACFFNLFSKV